MNQTDLIRKHLERGRALTPLDALAKFGCFRLAARIGELREAGMAIRVERVKLPSGKSIASYRRG